MAPKIPHAPRPILIPGVKSLEGLRLPPESASPPRRQPKRESAIMEQLAAPPVGPFDLADEQGRRLVPDFPNYLTTALHALRQNGVVEMVSVPCQCGRGQVLCSCPLAAFRLASAPARSNVIEAAERFRRAG